MEKKVKPKKCPFCQGTYNYKFKTVKGLVRHILNWHGVDSKGRHYIWGTDIAFVKVFSKTGVKFYPVNGYKELEEFVREYLLEEINPSKTKSKLWEVVESAERDGENS